MSPKKKKKTLAIGSRLNIVWMNISGIEIRRCTNRKRNDIEGPPTIARHAELLLSFLECRVLTQIGKRGKPKESAKKL
jgi:hypothetical protein